MRHEESTEKRCGWWSRVGVLRIVGSAVLALVAVEVIKSFPDIKRYWRIRHM